MLPPDLRDETYAALRDHIVPSAAQLRWCEIPWRRSLWEAVPEAVRCETPILLWAMDGNPLGMTCGNGIMGRERIWADPRVRELATHFVPAADDAGRLTRGAGPDCELFRAVAEQGHYGGVTIPTNTRQGIYAMTPDGVLLASENARDPRVVVAMMRGALARWSTRSQDSARAMPAGASSIEVAHPGLVLRVYARDLPVGDAVTGDWNQDHLWLTVSEARALVPSGAVGARAVASEDLALRIACKHLVDDVHGQSIAFPVEAVEQAVLGSEIVALEGGTVTLRFTGSMRASHTGIWPIRGSEDVASPAEQVRGYDMDLLGRGVFDRDAGQFRTLEIVAAGMRWGATQYNWRADDLAPRPLGIVFVLCEDDRYVAPALD